MLWTAQQQLECVVNRGVDADGHERSELVDWIVDERKAVYLIDRSLVNARTECERTGYPDAYAVTNRKPHPSLDETGPDCDLL